MIIQSAIIGNLCGILWGYLFTKTYYAGAPQKSTFSLVASSMSRLIFLAALLIFLLSKQYVVLGWWFAGFAGAFWAILLRQNPISQKDEHGNGRI